MSKGPAEVAVDRVLLAAAVVALSTLLCATFVLDRAVAGALPPALPALIGAWAASYVAIIVMLGRVRTVRGMETLRLVSIGIGVTGTLAASYLMGGSAWVGPYLVFFAVVGAAFMRVRGSALVLGTAAIVGFVGMELATAGGWIASYDPFGGQVSRDDKAVRYSTIAFLGLTLLAFFGISAILGFFVTLQRDLLQKASTELEAKKDELEALNAGLEQHVTEKTIELAVRNRELEVMARIGTIVNASLELEQVYQEFMTAAHDLIPFDYAAIAVLIDGGTRVRVLRVVHGPDGRLAGETSEDDIADSIHAGERPRIVEDFTAMEKGHRGEQTVVSRGIVSAAQVPIATKGRVLGAFNVASRAKATFTEEHARLMERMAEPLALAIDNCRLYDEMRHMAETDGLTGLPNRRAIARLIAHEIARGERSGEMCSVLVLDIDNFKVFNDTLGHQAGDDLLTSFASLLRGACRDSDVVARQAGDEFTILLPGSGPREATTVAQRIHDALSGADLTYPGQDGVVVRSSIGIATYPMDGEDDDALVVMADRAMYAAKAAGGGQSRLASRLTEREARADTSRQLRFGMLETLANRLAAGAQKSTAGEDQAFAMATARAAWAIGERMALDDSEQQLLRVAALAHSLGVLPSDDPRSTSQDFGLEEGLDEMYLKIGRVFVAGSPGLIDAVRVIARHHRQASTLADDDTSRYARILAVAERYADLTLGEQRTTPSRAMEQLRDEDALDQGFVQMLEEGLNLPAIWRAA